MIKDENTSTIVTLNVMACNLRKPTLGYNERAYQQSEHFYEQNPYSYGIYE